MDESGVLARLGLSGSELPGVAGGARPERAGGAPLVSINPAGGRPLGAVRAADAEDVRRVVERAAERFRRFRLLPAPHRGELVREIGALIRERRDDLAALISLEMGKIRAEAEGEVQETLDVCDFAVGLSRQLHGLTIASERPRHRLMEQWHPLGVVAAITPFNFPAAIWSWNAALAAVCGNTVVWKPSSLAPLCALALQRICDEAMARRSLSGVFNLVVGAGSVVGEALVADRRVALVSATGSTALGRRIGTVVAERFGRAILELGGNNAAIVLDDADLDLAARAVLFGALGTTGQRCTTTRRLIVQRGAAAPLLGRLEEAYATLKIGDPLDPTVHVGPLVSAEAVAAMQAALGRARAEGCEVLRGGRRIDRAGFFVEPAIVRADARAPIVREETFAPILYVVEVDSLEEAIRLNNEVPHGLSSAIFTDSLRAAETFLSAAGSDCGLANVNTGTSGAEIGGAFGGEKETGGGREIGSDAWKAYMRRQTSAVNFGTDLPLAQGVRFRE